VGEEEVEGEETAMLPWKANSSLNRGSTVSETASGFPFASFRQKATYDFSASANSFEEI